MKIGRSVAAIAAGAVSVANAKKAPVAKIILFEPQTIVAPPVVMGPHFAQSLCIAAKSAK
jgi:hypothetical protein